MTLLVYIMLVVFLLFSGVLGDLFGRWYYGKKKEKQSGVGSRDGLKDLGLSLITLGVYPIYSLIKEIRRS